MPSLHENHFQAIDLADLSLESLTKLSALFSAIARLSEHDAVVQELATIGAYLAEDYSNTLGEQRACLVSGGAL